jgi:hypothetical protein
VFAGGVILTHHGDGGGRGWGGRYFAVGLPLVVVVIAVIGRDLLGSMSRRSRVVALSAVVAVSLWSGYQQVRAVRDSHIMQDRLTQSALKVANLTKPGDGGVPIVITPDAQMARSVWAEFDDARWLLVPYEDLAEAARRLGDAGYEEATIATLDARRVVSALPGQVHPPLDDLPERDIWWYWVIDLGGT